MFGLLALVMLSIVLSGCSSPSATPGSTASPSPAATETAAVTIRDFAFKPDVVHVVAGGSVTWTNADGATHTIKFDAAESPAMGNGATYTKKFETPGSYAYHCGIHPSMTGTVVVE